MRSEFNCKISKNQKMSIFDENGFVFITLEENGIDEDEYSIFCVKEEDIKSIIECFQQYER